MNRPLTGRSPPARPGAARPLAQRAVAVGGSLLTASLVWVLIVYLTIPLYYFTGDFGVTNETGMSSSNPLGRTLKLVLLFASFGVILWKSRLALLELQALNRGFQVFLVLVPVSALWSIDPDATINRYLALLSMVSVCTAFTIHGWNRTRFQDVVRPAVTALVAASVVWALMYPQYGVEIGEGTLKNSWRGLTAQKNQLGMLSSFGVLFWLHAWLSRQKKAWIAFPFMGLCGLTVLASRSSTSLLATVLSALFMMMVMVTPGGFRRYTPYVVSSFAVLVIVYALAVLNIIPGMSILLDPITAFSGKDMTFSNRAVIWGIIKEHIALAPITGSGYGAYWTGPLPTSPSYVFLSRMGDFYPSQSHNGYLEIVNDLGFIGLACLLTYLYSWVSQSLQLLKFDRAQGGLFLALFLQQAITNLSESTWLAINAAFALAVGTLATFALSRALLEQRLRPAPPGAPRQAAAAGGRVRPRFR